MATKKKSTAKPVRQGRPPKPADASPAEASPAEASRDAKPRKLGTVCESIVNSLDHHIAVLAADGTIFSTNDAWNRFAKENGAPPLLTVGPGANYLEVCRKSARAGEPNAQSALQGIQRVMRGELPSFRMEYSCHSANQRRWFAMSVAPLEGSQGGAVVSHADMTEQMLARKQELHILRQFVEHAPMGVLMLDRRMRGVQVSRRWLQDVGMTREQVIGRSHYDNFPDMPAHWPAIHRRGLAGESISGHEELYNTPDGQEHCINWEITPWGDEGETTGGILIAMDDVSEQKKAEREARQSAEAIRALIESTPQSVIAVNREKIIVIANGNTERMFGYQRDELIGKSLDVLIPESDRKGHEEQFQAFFADMRMRPMGIGMDLKARRKDGSHFPVEIGLSSMETVSGKLAVAYITDTTERKRSEAALRESEERLRLAVEHTGLGSFDLDLRTGRRIISDVGKRHAGLPPGTEMTDALVQKLLPPEDWQATRRVLEEALREPKDGPYIFEFRLKAADTGEEKWLLARGRMVLDENKKPSRIVGIVLDITGRKQLEDSLRKKERDIELLTDNSPDVILRTDPQGRYKYVNATTMRAAGLPKEAFVGKTPRQMGLPANLADLWERTNRMVLETKVPQLIEFAYPSPGGETIWEERLVPEFAPDGTVESILTIGREITQRRALEKAARARADEVRALAARLLSVQDDERRRVSRELHDHICQQLASLAIEIGAYAAQPAPVGKQGQDYLKSLQARVIKASEQARHIAYELHPSMLDDLGLTASLRALSKDFSNQHPEMEVEFGNGHIPRHISREVASCVYRVAQESLHNVIKHAKAQHVSVSLGLSPGGLVLTISDDGVGFDPAEAKGRGGLGLVGVQERAELLKGKVAIASRRGRGTTVTLHLPIQEEAE